MNGTNIPKSMKDRPAWVCWKYERRNEKLTKVPINPATGGNAMSTNPDTWGRYFQTTAAQNRLGLDGIGFMFGDGFIGVDIDHCVNKDTGELSELAISVRDMLDSYTELSPSGTGVHIICRGTLPTGGRKQTDLGLEMYSEGRFFTVTGDRIHGAEVEERTAQLSELHAKYMKAEKPTPETRRTAPAPALSDDAALLQKIRESKQGPLFEQLHRGEWKGMYQSQSEADMALCNILAFWCDGDATMMDRIFRTSGLMREKWNEARNGSTYGWITINTAVADVRDGYRVRQADDWIPGKHEDPTEAAEDGQSIFAYAVPLRYEHEKIPEDAAYYKEKKSYTLDDTGNAERFYDLFGTNAKFCHNNKTWYVWNGKLWQEDLNGSIKRMAEQAISIMQREYVQYSESEEGFDYKNFMKQIRRVRSSQGKEAMIKETQHLAPVSPEEMDSEGTLVNCLNGVYDLESRQFFPHDRARFITRIAPVEYDAAAPEPKLWKAFLHEILSGDYELERFVQKAIGYSISGSAVEQCVFVMFGTGRNGKGVFIDVVRSVMGGYMMNAQAESIMARDRGNGGSASSDLARLKPARFVTCAETEEGKRLSEALIKQLTGGDSLTVRFLFSKEFEYTPTFKIWLATNHKPVIKGTDNGIWSRIRMIPFSVTIPEERRDPHLAEKLKTELPGIMNWAFEGYTLWKAEGLKSPMAVQAATKEYRTEMDMIASFLEECTRPDINLRVPATELYEAYKGWCGVNNERAMTTTKFGMKLNEHGMEKVKTMNGNVYTGLCLLKKAADFYKQRSYYADYELA